MKITEELFNEASGRAVEFVRNNCKGPLTDYYADILRYYLGKEVSRYVFTPVYYEKFSDDLMVKLGEFIISDLCEKYNLQKGMYQFSPYIEFGEGEKIEEPFPSLLFGDDLMLLLIKTKKRGKEAIVSRTIFYTSDSCQIAYNILQDINNKINELAKEFMTEESGKVEIKYSLVYTGESGFYEDRTKRVKTNKIELSEFNQDLPDDKIQEFIKKQNESGILIFHGDPGCGKTSYIKYLIQTNQDKQFSYLGLDMLGNQDKLREYVISKQKDDLVIIIEDCEKLLQSRNYGSSNATLSDILNISDGLIGDQTNTKFIFTFNSNLGSIDSALLRKGRLKCRYEFKPLQGERLKSLALELGLELSDCELKEGLPLCDLYNYNSEVEVEDKGRKIGFSR